MKLVRIFLKSLKENDQKMVATGIHMVILVLFLGYNKSRAVDVYDIKSDLFYILRTTKYTS